MKITINSMADFNELDYDRAYGVAKKLINSSHNAKVKRIGGKAFSALKGANSVMVTIHKSR